MEDAIIIDLYFKRDESAIEKTAEKYGKSLFTISDRIVESKEDAEECVNDTYHSAWTHIPPARPEFFFAYLAKITRHLSFDRIEYKKAKKRNAIVVELGEELENCLPAPDDYERRMDSQEIGQAITSFLNGQSEEMRKIFVRRYWYMDSVHDISVMYSISESKVKSVLFRMRNSLKKYLESEDIVL